MALPSTIREEVSQMQIELRDMKLQLAKDIMELREVLSSVAVELTGVMDKHKSLLTRIEGLEVRAQGIGYPSSKDEFNAFAYVQLDELEDFNEDTEEVLRQVRKMLWKKRSLTTHPSCLKKCLVMKMLLPFSMRW